MKKVKFFTLGCKVNQYETQGIREKFLNAGFRENNSTVADLYIINTCTVTARADRESRRLIRKARQSNPEARIIVTGCYVEKDASQLLQISDRIEIVPKKRLLRPFGARNDGISDFKDHQRAFVKIQDGCDNFCAYCKVPLVRGRSRSRSLQEIIEEVKRLINRGFKEIVLSGICLGDYRYRKLKLADVLTSLTKIKGEFRIRLSSIEPQLVSDRLIGIFNSPKVCPHLHIPLQSGDNKILKKMNRRYTQKEYLSLIAKIRKKIKGVAITTDVLVGFPGERDRNFGNTVFCLKEVLPLRTHIFSFSPRQGTAAFSLPARIERDVIKERTNLLKQVVAECSYKYRKQFLGKNLTVLIELKPDKQSGCFCGYSENYIRVLVENAIDNDVNQLLPVKVEDVDIAHTMALRDCPRRGLSPIKSKTEANSLNQKWS